jgi:hypothetical protein
MFEQDQPLSNSLPSPMPVNTLNVLERLRDSYKQLSDMSALTSADQAVRTVAGFALDHLAKAS